MGIVDFFKISVKRQKAGAEHKEKEFPLDRLDEDGELPMGWFTANKSIIDKLNNEQGYFLQLYLESQKKSPRNQYGALKSFVLHMENVVKLCKSKGECFEFWCNEVLIPKEYLQKHKEKLLHLEANFHQMQDEYERRIVLLEGLESKIIQTISENPDILQSDLVKLFDPLIKNDVRDALYHMAQENKIKRIKSGRSYILKIKTT